MKENKTESRQRTGAILDEVHWEGLFEEVKWAEM